MSAEVVLQRRPETYRLLDSIKRHPVQSTGWYALHVRRPSGSVRRDLALLQTFGLIRKVIANDGTSAWMSTK